ncbi:MAG: hypothetical protein EOO53_09835 [Gammaproteobacteria bacterium]|nr:MAG: hypothetical protein EOO53_09835 [Gammaproteobacteria bacterium]
MPGSNQQALQINNEGASHSSLKVIQLEHVSVSQLLGRDYIFIDSQHVKLPLQDPTVAHGLLNDLIKQLELSEAYTVVVTIEGMTNEEPVFTRHDLIWHRHEVCRIDSIVITHHEQHEFIDMIWRCSTAALSDSF